MTVFNPMQKKMRFHFMKYRFDWKNASCKHINFMIVERVIEIHVSINHFLVCNFKLCIEQVDENPAGTHITPASLEIKYTLQISSTILDKNLSSRNILFNFFYTVINCCRQQTEFCHVLQIKDKTPHNLLKSQNLHMIFKHWASAFCFHFNPDSLSKQQKFQHCLKERTWCGKD